METKTKIVVMGDIHAEFGRFNKFLNPRKIDIILQTGDFGFWPRWSWKMWHPHSHSKKPIPTVKSKNTKIYFCDGNHEDHESLQLLTNNEVYPNTFYMKRGSTMRLPDGRNVLFIGGANSVDKESRKMGLDWFPSENITQSEILSIDPNTKIDIVISHTAPNEFPIENYVRGINDRSRDSNRDALSYILKTFNPPLWYFGHWHVYATGYNCGCRWTALDCINFGGKWWEELKE